MKRKPERIDSVVKSVIGRLDKQANPTSDEIASIWKEAVGGDASQHTKPASLRKKRLVVDVDGSAWLYELTLKKREILNKLRNRLGKDKIEQLQFRIGEV